MNKGTVTHIHLKKEENTVQAFIVDNHTKVEERITLLPSEMYMPMTLSRAIVFVKTEHVDLLLESQLVDQIISSELDGVTSVLLNKQIHKFFDKGQEAYFTLTGNYLKEGV